MGLEVDVKVSPDATKFKEIKMTSGYLYYRLYHTSPKKVAASELNMRSETLLPG